MAGFTNMILLCLLSTLITITLSAYCDSPSPGFLVPDLHNKRHASKLSATADRIRFALSDLASTHVYDKTHFSLEVTSQTSKLFSMHWTARERSSVHPGAKRITHDTAFRIASMTKPFTVLALLQQHKAGNLSLDDPVLKYLPKLDTTGSGNGAAGLPWKDITIRALASQNSGIPRDLAQGDLVGNLSRAAKFGLPDADRLHESLQLPTCDGVANYTRACNATDLLLWVDQLPPVYAPNQKSSYSNINFDLLGLVIANVSGLSYEDYVTTRILHEIGMNGSSFSTPPDEYAAIPKGMEYYWPFEIGVQNPTGGLYSSSADMSRWLRYVLSSYNAQEGLNWFNPASFSGSVSTYYGMPWEMMRVRTNEVIESKSTRPITLVMKGGGLPGYTSNVVMVPEYGLGVTILVAGEGRLMPEIQEIVVREMVQYAESVARKELKEYTGRYKHGSDMIVIGMTERDGLFVKKWMSNGKDVKAAFEETFNPDRKDKLVAHIVPTLLFVDEEKQEGERWRIVFQRQRKHSGKKSIWDSYCVSDIEAFGYYVGKPVNEIVFWGGKHGGKARALELTGFRKKLQRAGGDQDSAIVRFKEQMGL